MPTVRRVSPRSASPEEKEPPKNPPLRRRQAAQAQARRPVQRTRTRTDSDEKRSAPLLLRILSWLGIILLCFVLGYLGTSWFMDFLNRKLLLKPENRIETQEDFTEFQEAENERNIQETSRNGADVQQISLNLYHVKGDTLAETRKNFVSRTKEDNIRDAVEEILSLSGAPKMKLLHVFRNDETAFLDMPGQFASAISSMGKRKSLLLLTGLVRTLQENFSPITQIRFLIDSQPPKSGGEVNLAAPWKMPKKS
ncbi:MAG: GerMN domain-containing protein [Synergistaceae bacterium]|nr:GerMN domain-containing protein [Synergistaceae bacterium]